MRLRPGMTAAALGLAWLSSTAQAQRPHYVGAIAGGHAFMVDADDPDPAGSLSLSASLERRREGRALSTGVEAGFHRYLVIAQDLPPDVTGFASILEDTRQAWRITPYLRWRTRGPVSLQATLGAGVYVRRTAYFQEDRMAGEVVYDTRYATTRARAGFNLGVGVELLPRGSPIGLGLGFRSHAVLGGDGFNTAEVGLVWRWPRGTRRAMSPPLRSGRQ